MKARFLIAGTALAAIASGCGSSTRVDGPPGTAAGNVRGATPGAVEGTSVDTNSPLGRTQRIIRYWHEEKTPDGRTVLVPEDWLVDKDGRMIRKLK